MNVDDSFNDSDEIISLYSSKKVKETFRAQLQKIVSSSHNVNGNTNTASEENSEKIVDNEPKQARIQDKTTKTPIEVVRSSTPIEVVKSSTPIDSGDDSIEVVSEFTPVRQTRQSERLRKKRNESLNNSIVSNDTPPRKQPKRNRKRQKKNNQKNGLPIDTVVLDDSEVQENVEEDLNPEVSVKVIWKSVNIKKFQIRKFQKFARIFELLSQEENIPEEKIMLTFNNVKVSRNATPDSLNLQIYHFLDGGVLTELTNSQDLNSSITDGGDKISVKFQDINKKAVIVRMDRKDKMKIGMIKCSEQLEIPMEKIKFYFDGELLGPSETPESLGLENDEIIDIKICS